MLKKFKTIAHVSEAEIVEKKSRFIATVTPVSNEDEAQQFLHSMKKKYYDARHNAFAYCIGERDEIQRCSDDGEPSGTAGLPVLDVLKGEQLKNVCVNVTRYFGGTLLGTGGLIRAYGKAAKDGLVQAGIIEKILYRHVYIRADYNLSGKIQYEIMQGAHVLHDTVYTEVVAFDVLVVVDEAERFIQDVIDFTNGKATIETGAVAYVTRP